MLVTEPARDGGCCVTGRKGAARMKIVARGKPAHSGVSHSDGESAVLEMARQIVDLEAMTDYETGVTVNVGLLSGGTGVNVVPEICTAELDIRMTRPEDGAAAVAKVQGIRPYNPAVELTISGGMNRPPYRKSNAIASLYEHARGLASEIGFELGETFTGGGSDGNFYRAGRTDLGRAGRGRGRRAHTGGASLRLLAGSPHDAAAAALPDIELASTGV